MLVYLMNLGLTRRLRGDAQCAFLDGVDERADHRIGKQGIGGESTGGRSNRGVTRQELLHLFTDPPPAGAPAREISPPP